MTIKFIKRLTILLFLTSTLASCSIIEGISKKPVGPLDNLSNVAKMDIKQFFNGEIDGAGIIQDDSGKIIGTYVAQIEGEWNENKGIIKYNFTLDGHKKDSRTWLITLNSDGSFEGIGHDILKTAQGAQAGNAMRMLYSLGVKKDGQKEEVKYEDKVYLVSKNAAILISKSDQKGSKTKTSIISLTKKEKKFFGPVKN